MKPRLIAVAFVLSCLAQIALPAWRILEQIDLLHDAPRFLCRVRPIDPVDPFRGRYLRIDLAGLDALPVEDTLEESASGRAYLVLSEGDDGFADYRLEADVPKHDAWIRVRYTRQGGTARVSSRSLPFSRYYLEESKAQAADRAYREAARDAEAWIALRVERGNASLEELYLEGEPIAEWLRDREDPTTRPSGALSGDVTEDPPQERDDREAE